MYVVDLYTGIVYATVFDAKQERGLPFSDKTTFLMQLGVSKEALACPI